MHGPVMGKIRVRGGEETGARTGSQLPGRCRADWVLPVSCRGLVRTHAVRGWREDHAAGDGHLGAGAAGTAGSGLGAAGSLCCWQGRVCWDVPGGCCVGTAAASEPLSSMKLPGAFPAMSRVCHCPHRGAGHALGRRGAGGHVSGWLFAHLSPAWEVAHRVLASGGSRGEAPGAQGVLLMRGGQAGQEEGSVRKEGGASLLRNVWKWFGNRAEGADWANPHETVPPARTHVFIRQSCGPESLAQGIPSAQCTEASRGQKCQRRCHGLPRNPPLPPSVPGLAFLRVPPGSDRTPGAGMEPVPRL